MATSAVAPKEKFEAAVRVIQSLPKNGSFQPSHEMMLRFYGLYKQAKFGACTEPRPAFWDVVRKAKWDAWKKLEGLSQEAAMLQYVEELKKVIETMPHTPDVSAFLETLGTFYELVDVEEAMGGGGSAPTSTAANGQGERIRRSIKMAASRMNRNRGDSGSGEAQPGRQNGGLNGSPLNGSDLSSPDIDFSDEEEEEEEEEDDEEEDEEEEEEEEEDDEEFCDVASSRSFSSLPRAEPPDGGAMVAAMTAVAGRGGANGPAQQLVSGGGALSQHILRALSRLEHDLQALAARLDAMEGLLRTRLPDGASAANAARLGGAGHGGSGGGGGANDPPWRPWWWQLPFDRLALRNVVFIVLWPLVVQFLGRWLLRRMRARSVRRALTQ